MSLRGAYATLRDRGPKVLVLAVANLARAQVERRVFGRRFIERRIHDYRMLLDLDDPGISRALLLFGTREVDHKIILQRVLRPGMRVFDIGANIGYYVLMELSLIGVSGKVVAVEPSPANIDLMRRSFVLNGHQDVEVVAGAVSDRDGSDTFYLSNESNLNTFHPTGSGAQHLSGKTIEVTTCTVPSLAQRYGVPDLIRMDVEGHEVSVFNGMLDAVRTGRIRPMIIFETHLTRYGPENDMEAALRGLFQCGYTVRYLASSWQRGSALIEARGYRGSTPIATDGVERKIFENINDEDALDFICHGGGARTVLLAMNAQRIRAEHGARS